MHLRSPIASALLVLAVCAGLGARCGDPRITIVQPVDEVTTFQFVLEVQVPAGTAFDPASDVLINGAPVPVSGGSGTWTANVSPGFPLRDANRIEVNATTSDGRVLFAYRDFAYSPPKARARRITDATDLTARGPLAHARIGDWLLENTVARFVVQDAAERDLYSVGGFGGNLIDAGLLNGPGEDHFLEIQPMLNLETVINAQTAEVVNDGQDGTPAIVRTCGPDDLLDFVNPSSAITDAGIPSPTTFDDRDLEIQACTEYVLAPGESRVRLDTTVMNDEPQSVALAVGDWINAAGQLEQWDRPFQMGQALLGVFDVVTYVGYDEGKGIDYSYATVPVSPPLVGAAPSNLFTTSGVTIALHDVTALGALLGGQPPFVVPSGGELAFSRFVSVGDGSGANGVDNQLDFQGKASGTVQGCVTAGGEAVEGARVSLVTRSSTGAITRMDSQFTTKPGPCPNYGGAAPVGTFDIAAARDGSPYEGGGPVPLFKPVTVQAGQASSVDFALGAPGRLHVQVLDAADQPLPARVTVVGFDPSPAQISAGPSFPGFGGSTVGLFRDPTDRLPFGVVAFAYADASGQADLEVEPGSYQLFVSRGTEYSQWQAPITVVAGANAPVQAQIARVIDTTGFVSSDFHVHGVRSADSRVADGRRVRQFAGEGVENIIMTDHHVHTDLRPRITDLGLTPFVTSTIGEEITTFDYGHFNGYPFLVDPTRVSGGSTDWGKAAPPGRDFPAYGAYNGTPAEIWALATAGSASTPATIVQVNHIDSHYAPMQIDTSVAGPIHDGLDDTERANRRLPPQALAGNLFFPFPALELWNGASRGAQREFLDQRIGIWMNELNKGLAPTAIADTDTHTYADLRTAGARTWTASSTDVVSAIDPAEVAAAVDAGRAVGGQGLYVQTRLLAGDGSGGAAALDLASSNTVVTSNGAVMLEVHVQAPAWAPFDTVEVYANAATVPVDPTKPYLYGATPALVLSEGDCDPATRGDGDFDVDRVAVGGAERLETTLSVPFSGLKADTWFAVVVRGRDGVCAPMFPAFAEDLGAAQNLTLVDLLDGNVGEGGLLALGFTNALYADVDGTPGFQPPNP